MPLDTARAQKNFVALSWVSLKERVFLNVMNIKTEHICDLSRKNVPYDICSNG